MATAPPQARHCWHQALRLKKHLKKQLKKLQAECANGIDISRFEAIESLLEKFRLSFVQTIFLDFAYATDENAEDALWTSHTSINAEYRRFQSRLEGSSHAVERRKVEKCYNNFLRVAQKFYKGYVQRLAARYEVPELIRVAQGIEVEHMDNVDRVNPVPPPLRARVLESCHATLLHLGDLARYRTQAGHKNPSYETALTYYSLAHHLRPNSGHAYHQMGIVHLDQGNHLDVVYYFYRSWAVELPHPNARSNLETEFKSLALSSSSKSRSNVSATQDAFSMWFVRLHALFYKGEPFPQQAELEGEVMHRLDMACRTKTSTATLCKMAIVNISAHHIAATKYAESQDKTSSQFYQFTLRFGALFLSQFCAALEAELTNGPDAAEPLQGAQMTPVVEALLPVLRLYCMWLAAHRREIHAALPTFGGVVPGLVRNLAKAFTLLVVSTYHENMSSCPYLLDEDVEIQGLPSLSGESIPDACRCFCMENGALKTLADESKSRLDGRQESLARVLDILRCAYFLAEDGVFPLSHKVLDNWLIFEYQSDMVASQNATPAPLVGTPSLRLPDGLASHNEQRHDDDQSSRQHVVLDDSALIHEDYEPALATAYAVRDEAQMDDAESAIIDMLTPFLKPPTPSPQRRPSLNEPSYGMHNKTASDGTGHFRAGSRQTGSVPSGTFAALPWAWFNTPRPSDDDAKLSLAMDASR